MYLGFWIPSVCKRCPLSSARTIKDPPTLISENCWSKAYLVGLRHPAHPQIKTSPDSLSAADIFHAETWIMFDRVSILIGLIWFWVVPVPTYPFWFYPVAHTSPSIKKRVCYFPQEIYCTEKLRNFSSSVGFKTLSKLRYFSKSRPSCP